MITRYDPADFHQLLETWEASVRATHGFLQEVDIILYRGILQGFDFTSFPVFCLKDVPDQLIGFMGVAGNKLEMLFLRPDYIGKGLGRKMMDFALNELQVEKVDVNEQNEKALAFYTDYGFRVVNRRPIDDHGKAYPILEMELARKTLAR